MSRLLIAALLVSAVSALPAQGLVITTNGDTFVDKTAANANTNYNLPGATPYLAVKTLGGTDPAKKSNPMQFAFIQFATGDTQADDVALSLTTSSSAAGARAVGGYLYAKVNSFDETTLTFNNSFLGGAGGLATTDGSFAQVTDFIANAGWTRLDAGAGPAGDPAIPGAEALAKLGGLASSATYTSNPVDLKDFYNDHLSSTITVLFVPCLPYTGNDKRWVAKDYDVTKAAMLTVTPEPTSLLLLAMGGLLLRRGR